METLRRVAPAQVQVKPAHPEQPCDEKGGSQIQSVLRPAGWYNLPHSLRAPLERTKDGGGKREFHSPAQPVRHQH